MQSSSSNTNEGEIDFDLHPKQGYAFLSKATEIGYGGAAGGGKSHLGRISAIYFSYAIPGLQTYLFRRQSNELVKNHMEGPTSFPALLAAWCRNGFARIVKNEIRFANGLGQKFEGGSKIFLCHCQYEKDVFHWLGPEIHYLIIEQAEQFTPFMITMLRGRNRIPEALKIPDQYKELFPRCLYTFNPGDVGHEFFKKKFVKARKHFAIEEMPDEEGGKLRQFIPAKLDDNPSVNPIEYRKTLRGLPPKIAKALEEGDFDAVIGAFFPQLDKTKHLIFPFQIPQHWPKFMSMDWGACGEGDPFSIGWYAVADGTTIVQSAWTEQQMFCQRGSLICYRRWNGSGLLKQEAVSVARGILSREREEILFRIAGGDIMEKKGHGESIFSLFSKEGVHFKRADMRRLNGWAQVDYRLTGENDYPLSFWFEDCEEDLDTIGSLQHELTGGNDAAKGNDHDADRHRYACMTRPIAKDSPADVRPDYRSKNERYKVEDLVKIIEKTDSGYVKQRR